MRELKFRAWHTEQKRMIDVYGLGKDFVTENTLDGVDPGHNAFCDDDMNFIHVMQYTGLKDKNGVELYEDDLLLFDFVEDGFERSKAGEIMKEKGATQLLLHITPSECLETSIEIYFLRDNKKLTNNDWFGYEVECGSEVYSQTEDGAIHFLKYLLNKNLRCVGNIYQNPRTITTNTPLINKALSK